MRYLLLLGAMLAALALAPPLQAEELIPLQVTTALPQGKVEGELHTVTLIFNKPVVALEAISSAEPTPVFQMFPKVPGTFRWVGEKELLFTSEKPFPKATRFTVTIPSGLKALDGSRLSASYSWSFETLRPKVISVEPSNGEDNVDLNVHPFLQFNQSVDLKAIKPYIRLLESTDSITSKVLSLMGKKGTEVPITLVHPTQKEWKERFSELPYDSAVYVIPGQRLEAGKTYSLIIDAGVKGVEGPLGMENATVKAFTTYGVFGFKGGTHQQVRPGEGLELEFSSPVDTSNQDLKSFISFEPRVDLSSMDSSSYWGGRYLRLYSIPLKAKTDYRVTIKKGLKDIYGNRLKEDVTFTLKVGSYEPFYSFRSGVGIIENYGKWWVPIELININALEVRKAKIPLEQVIPFYQKFWESRQQPLVYHWPIHSLWQPGLPENLATVLPIDLKEALPGNTGIVAVELYWPEGQKEHPWLEYERGLYQVTNVGITGKFSAKSTLLWVSRLKDAAPLGKARVELRDSDNKVLWTGETDGKGFVEAPGWEGLGVKKKASGRPWIWALVTHEEGEAFISSDWDWGIEPYRFNISSDWEVVENRIRGYLFTERGLYRPGEEVKIKGIFRENKDGAYAIPSARSGTLKLFNSEGKEVHSEPVTLSDMGSFDTTLHLTEEMTPGPYSIRCDLSLPGANATGTAGFQIASFRPASFKVEVLSDKNSYEEGEKAQIKIRSSYLFGAPLKGGTAHWAISRQETLYDPPGHEGYVFGNSWDWYWDEESSERTQGTASSGNGILNDQGELALPLLALNFQSTWGTMSYQVEGSVKDASFQEISGRTSLLVHPGSFYIGIRPSTTFLKEKDKLLLDLLTVSPDGAIVSGKELTIKLIRREWKSVRQKEINGRYRWVSNWEETLMDEKKVTSASRAATVELVPSQAGFYHVRVTAKDEKNRDLQSTIYLYVTGSSYAGWRMDDSDKIQLVPDKKQYQAGDSARVLVKSPYPETDALVTVEREGVLDHWTVHLNGSADSITVPIRKEYLPNVYLSVILVKGRVGNQVFDKEGMDIAKPSFKIGYINLPVSPEEKRLKVKAQTSQIIYRPGEEVDVELLTADGAGKGIRSEVTLAAVDIGVLSLDGFRTPNPFGFFYGPRPLSVLTSELRHHIIGQRVYGEKGKSGGGGEDKEAGPALDLSMRKDFRYTAFWLPALTTDDNGRAKAHFKLPDSLTAFRIMAVAHTADGRFGNGDTEIKTQKPLMVRPVLPRFIRVAENFTGGVLLHNEGDRPLRVRLEVKTEGIAFTGKTGDPVELEAHTSRRIDLPFLAPPKSGQAGFTFTATEVDASGQAGKEWDGVTLSIPVRLAAPLETVAFYGDSEQSVEKKVKIPEGEGSLGLSLTSTALSGLSGSVEYLFDYPYGCLEQQMSRVLPMILFGDVVKEFNLPVLKDADYRAIVQQTLDKVSEYQHYDGGFSIWPDDGRSGSEPYISTYTVFGLWEASRKGYAINQQSYEKGLNYLQQFLRTESHPVYRADEVNAVKAFILYILAENGRYDAGYGQYLYEHRQEMPFFGRAMLLKAVQRAGGPDFMREKLKQELLNGLVLEGGYAFIHEPEKFGSYWIFNSDARSTSAALLAFLDGKEKVEMAPSMARWLSGKAEGGRWRTTQENLFVFWALGSYYQVYEQAPPNLTLKVKAGNAIPPEVHFAGRSFKVENLRWNLQNFTPKETTTVRIDKEGTGRFYYRMDLKYAPQAPLPPREVGIAIRKSFYTLDGKSVVDGKFKLGEIYRVQLDISTSSERSYVAIESPLPAGFEPVNTSLATESKEAQQKMEEARNQDEDYWWWYIPFNRTEVWDDRVVVFSNYLPEGINSYSYLVRATIGGKFRIPPDHAEMMYAPEVFGRDQEMKVEVR